MKKKVRFLMSVAGTGDPSASSLARKYAQMTRDLSRNSLAAQQSGKTGKSTEEIEAIVDAERRRDAKIPRVSGFDHEFSFKPNDIAMIPADVADKWESCGICIAEDSSTSAVKK